MRLRGSESTGWQSERPPLSLSPRLFFGVSPRARRNFFLSVKFLCHISVA